MAGAHERFAPLSTNSMRPEACRAGTAQRVSSPELRDSHQSSSMIFAARSPHRSRWAPSAEAASVVRLYLAR
jgi:hypothetical protein